MHRTVRILAAATLLLSATAVHTDDDAALRHNY